MEENDKPQAGDAGTPSAAPDQPAPPGAVPDQAASPAHLRESPPRKRNPVFLALSVLLSIGGVAGFVYLFVREFNVYWLILSPVIIALYQVPAVFVYWFYKRGRPVR